MKSVHSKITSTIELHKKVFLQVAFFGVENEVWRQMGKILRVNGFEVTPE